MSEPKSDSRHWLDRPGSAAKLVRALMIFCVLVLVADFFYEKHVHYGWEKAPAFYAIFGFSAYVFLVFVATAFRRFVMRKEDYYD